MKHSAILWAMLGLCITVLPARADDIQPGQVIGPIIDLMGKAIEAERYKNSPEGQAAAIQPGGLTRSQVMLVQQLLVKRGYDVGTVDGFVGPKTMVVVGKFSNKLDCLLPVSPISVF